MREQGKDDANQARGVVDRDYKVGELIFLRMTIYKDKFSSEKKLWF